MDSGACAICLVGSLVSVGHIALWSLSPFSLTLGIPSTSDSPCDSGPFARSDPSLPLPFLRATDTGVQGGCQQRVLRFFSSSTSDDYFISPYFSEPYKVNHNLFLIDGKFLPRPQIPESIATSSGKPSLTFWARPSAPTWFILSFFQNYTF